MSEGGHDWWAGLGKGHCKLPIGVQAQELGYTTTF